MIHDDVGDLTQRHGRTTRRSDLALRILDRHLLQLIGRRDRLLVEDVESFVQGVDEPTGAGRRGLEEGERGDLQSVAGGPDDLVERDVRVVETLRVDQDLQLPVTEPPGRDVRDPFDPEQSRGDHPLGQDGHLDRRELVRRQLHHRDTARRGDGLDHLRRLRNLRETRGRDGLGQTLTDDLARVEHAGPGLEGHDHRREPGQRDRLDLLEERDTHEQVLLERHRDQLLDLLGGEPEGLRLDLDGGSLEFGQDVRAGVVQLQNAVDEEPDGNRDHQTTELDARTDDPPHHDCATSTSRSRGSPWALARWAPARRWQVGTVGVHRSEWIGRDGSRRTYGEARASSVVRPPRFDGRAHERTVRRSVSRAQPMGPTPFGLFAGNRAKAMLPLTSRAGREPS